ncbi:hypothetical protein M9458_047629, partial [Cirrhinus mrigala]
MEGYKASCPLRMEQSGTADPEPSALVPHDSSGITPDNMSTISSSLYEDNVDEREGECSCSILQIANIMTQDMSGQDGISSIPEY